MHGHVAKEQQNYQLRQLAALLIKGETLEQALQHWSSEDVVCKYYQQHRKLAGCIVLPKVLDQFLRQVTPDQEAEVIKGYQAQMEQLTPTFSANYMRLQALTVYFGMVSLVSLILINFVVFMVIPPFANLFTLVGNDLTALTRAELALSTHDALVTGVTVFFILSILIMIIARSFLKWQWDMPPVIKSIPFVSKIIQAQREAETIHWAMILQKAGLPFSSAITASSKITGIKNTNYFRGVTDTLTDAERIGTLPTELTWQIAQAVRRVEYISHSATQWLTILAYLLIGFLVCTMIIAIYLPLFLTGFVPN